MIELFIISLGYLIFIPLAVFFIISSIWLLGSIISIIGIAN